MIKRAPIVLPDRVLIPLTRGQQATVDIADADLGQQFNWYAWRNDRGQWYAARRKCDGTNNIMGLHQVIGERLGLLSAGLMIDHIDGNGLDCRRANLRSATRAQNAHNSAVNSTSRSGHKGVSYNKARRKWVSSIGLNGTRHFLGFFETLEAAADAYRSAAIRLHGEYASTRMRTEP